jgi:hypothetical protein
MLRVRQIALVASDDLAAAREFIDVLGLSIAYHDPQIGRIKLHNTLLPVGTQIIEIVAPLQSGITAERYLARRKGSGGYMVITQTDNHPARRARVDELGIRIVGQFDDDGFTNMQLHPRDTGGSFFEIDYQAGGEDPMGPWSPAGPDWQSAIRTELVSAITAAEMQCDDPEKVASRWSEIVEIDRADVDGVPTIPLDNATLRFVGLMDDRGEGLAGIDLQCSDPDAVKAKASERGLPVADDHVKLVGMRCYLRR